MMDRKKRKGGAEKLRESKKRALKSDAAKCIKLTEIFSKGLNSAAAAEDSSAVEELRRKQKI